MGMSLQNNRWSVIIQRLLYPHGAPRIVFAVSKEDVVDHWYKSIVTIIGGQHIFVDLLRIETKKRTY